MRNLLVVMLISVVPQQGLCQTPTSETNYICADSSPAPKKLIKVFKSGDGKTRETAFKVSSVAQEYQMLACLGLKPESQALVLRPKAYDLLTVIDPGTSEKREVWFDISKFFGGMF